jgi:FkbM family methyltransferase
MRPEEIETFRKELDMWYEQRMCSEYPTVSREHIKHNGVVVYGASTIGKVFTSQLIECGIIPDWVIDKNPDLTGSLVLGLNVRSPESLLEIGDRFVLLASTHMGEMAEMCKRYKAKWILPYSTREFCPLLTDIGIVGTGNRYIKEIIDGFNLMGDNKSADLYKSFIRYHHIFDNDYSLLRNPVEYFPGDLVKQIDYSCFVDAGAYNGDTLKTWISQGYSDNKDSFYYAFEPSASAYSELNEFISVLPQKERIMAYNIGLGDKYFKTQVVGNADGMNIIANKQDPNQANKQTGECIIDTLDNVLKDKEVTVIKADVEGFEMDLLRGAVMTITEQRPTLMISVYHRYSDLWNIPLWINNLNLDYDIYLRHAPNVFTDTTCYAIPQ